MQSAFTSRREQLESVSSTRERSVDICNRLLPLDERLYLAPSASLRFGAICDDLLTVIAKEYRQRKQWIFERGDQLKKQASRTHNSLCCPRSPCMIVSVIWQAREPGHYDLSTAIQRLP
ncbi:hypothetical protein TNCV_4082611 [Trichonephila clavipes]|nr:hypothetical protein TNCV_4082611 [Trichonephila clavipes]